MRSTCAWYTASSVSVPSMATAHSASSGNVSHR